MIKKGTTMQQQSIFSNLITQDEPKLHGKDLLSKRNNIQMVSQKKTISHLKTNKTTKNYICKPSYFIILQALFP